MCKLCTTSRIVNSAFRIAYHSLCWIFPLKIKQNSTERVFLTFIWMENGATVVAQFRQHSIPLFEAICQPFWIFSCICVCCGLLASHSIYILSFFSYYIFYMCFLLFFRIYIYARWTFIIQMVDLCHPCTPHTRSYTTACSEKKNISFYWPSFYS